MPQRLNYSTVAPKSTQALIAFSMPAAPSLDRRLLEDARIAEMTFAAGAIRAWNMPNASSRQPVPEVPYVVSE